MRLGRVRAARDDRLEGQLVGALGEHLRLQPAGDLPLGHARADARQDRLECRVADPACPLDECDLVSVLVHPALLDDAGRLPRWRADNALELAQVAHAEVRGLHRQHAAPRCQPRAGDGRHGDPIQEHGHVGTLLRSLDGVAAVRAEQGAVLLEQEHGVAAGEAGEVADIGQRRDEQRGGLRAGAPRLLPGLRPSGRVDVRHPIPRSRAAPGHRSRCRNR